MVKTTLPEIGKSKEFIVVVPYNTKEWEVQLELPIKGYVRSLKDFWVVLRSAMKEILVHFKDVDFSTNTNVEGLIKRLLNNSSVAVTQDVQKTMGVELQKKIQSYDVQINGDVTFGALILEKKEGISILEEATPMILRFIPFDTALDSQKEEILRELDLAESVFATKKIEITSWHESEQDAPTFYNVRKQMDVETAMRSLVRRAISLDIQKYKAAYNNRTRRLLGYTPEEQSSFQEMFHPYDRLVDTGGYVLLRTQTPGQKVDTPQINGCDLDRASKRRKVVQLHTEVPDSNPLQHFTLFGDSRIARLSNYEVIAGTLYKPAAHNLLTLIIESLQFMLNVQTHNLEAPTDADNDVTFKEKQLLAVDNFKTIKCNPEMISSTIERITEEIKDKLLQQTEAIRSTAAQSKKTDADTNRGDVTDDAVENFYGDDMDNFNGGDAYFKYSSFLEELHAKDPILFFYAVPTKFENQFTKLFAATKRALKNAGFDGCKRFSNFYAAQGETSAIKPAFKEYVDGDNGFVNSTLDVDQMDMFRATANSKYRISLMELIYIRPRTGETNTNTLQERWIWDKARDTRVTGIVTLSMWREALKTEQFDVRLPHKLDAAKQLGLGARKDKLAVSRVRFDSFSRDDLEFNGLITSGAVEMENMDEVDAVAKAFEVDRDLQNMKAFSQEFEHTLRLVFEAILNTTAVPTSDVTKEISIKEFYNQNTEDMCTRGVVFFPYFIEKDVPPDIVLAKLDEMMPSFELVSLTMTRAQQEYPVINGNKIPLSAASVDMYQYAFALSHSIEGRSGHADQSLEKLMNHRLPFGKINIGYTDAINKTISLISSVVKLRTVSEKSSSPYHICLFQALNEAESESDLRGDYGMPFEPGLLHFDSAHIRSSVGSSSAKELVYCIGSESTLFLESVVIATKLIQLLATDDGSETADLSYRRTMDESTPLPNDLDSTFKEAQGNLDDNTLTNTFTYNLDDTDLIVQMGPYYKYVGSPTVNVARNAALAENVADLETSVKLAPGYYMFDENNDQNKDFEIEFGFYNDLCVLNTDRSSMKSVTEIELEDVNAQLKVIQEAIDADTSGEDVEKQEQKAALLAQQSKLEKKLNDEIIQKTNMETLDESKIPAFVDPSATLRYNNAPAVPFTPAANGDKNRFQAILWNILAKLYSNSQEAESTTTLHMEKLMLPVEFASIYSGNKFNYVYNNTKNVDSEAVKEKLSANKEKYQEFDVHPLSVDAYLHLEDVVFECFAGEGNFLSLENLQKKAQQTFKISAVTVAGIRILCSRHVDQIKLSGNSMDMSYIEDKLNEETQLFEPVGSILRVAIPNMQTNLQAQFYNRDAGGSLIENKASKIIYKNLNSFEFVCANLDGSNKKEKYKDSLAARQDSSEDNLSITAVKKTSNTSLLEVANILISGFQGFHFSNLKSLQRTVFAVAMGANLRKCIKWCTTLAMFKEPRAINLQLVNSPAPKEDTTKSKKGPVEFYDDLSFGVRDLNYHDAVFLTLVRNGDRAQQYRVFGGGGSSGAAAYGNRFQSTLVTPAIVLVRGPGPTALTTPCRIGAYCCKTAAFRLVEARVVERIYVRFRQVRAKPAGVNTNCLYDKLAQHKNRKLATTRELIQARHQIIDSLAKLFLECHNQNRVTEKTSRAYSKSALTMQEAGIVNSVEQVLFHS